MACKLGNTFSNSSLLSRVMIVVKVKGDNGTITTCQILIDFHHLICSK
jgi:hypothetical protein